MDNKNKDYAGFVQVNSGEITECYSNISFKGSKNINGFCSKNSGEIKDCYSNCEIKESIFDGFCSINNGKIDSCFYNKEKANTVNTQKSNSGVVAITKSDLTKKFIEKLNWDIKNTWKLSENNFPQFKKDFFLVHNEKASEYTKIDSEEKLFEFARKVNEGDKNFSQGKFILTKNIDLNGKQWIPIGLDSINPFSGYFDGNGFCISNFKITNKNLNYVGFFGYLKDANIINLTIDGIIKNIELSGMFAGVNENSLIACCGCACSIDAKNFSAGFVNRNSGQIRKCYVIGKISKPLVSPTFLKIFLPLLLALLILAGYFIYNLTKQKLLPEYPNMPISKYATYVDDGLTPSTDSNSVTFSVGKEIIAENGTALSSINLKNPGSSNQHMKISLQITDQELKDKNGKTGRTAEEQYKLENMSNYDPITQRVTVATSDIVPPKYVLEKIQLNKLPDGSSLSKGDYNAIAYLEFYDIDSNAKAVLNSQVPVVLKVQN